jgi:predicted nucleotidyltransferase
MEELLFSTNVGSHMWGMNTSESDIDISSVYVVDTKHMLSGYSIHNTRPDKTYMKDGMKVDEKFQEIGHLVNKIISGNVNAMWTVCTPLVIKDHATLRILRDITMRNLSRASYDSINGMARSQLKDVVKRTSVMPEGKALKTAFRTCQFGITLLSQGRIVFEPVVAQPTEDHVKVALRLLDEAYKLSSLPERVDETEFRQFLLNTRMNRL